MRVSTRGRYGLRAMLELARHFGNTPVLMGTLAEREDVSRKYLHALLTALKSAGLVRSMRGAAGGFVLTRAPSEIRLSEVLRALEGPLAVVDCVRDKHVCVRANRCIARRVWQDLSGAIERVLDDVTLQDLLSSRGKARFKPAARKQTRTARSRSGSAKTSAKASRRRQGRSDKR